MELSEEFTWKKIQQKDAEVFERYYKEHYKSFWMMAFKYMKDKVQAEEIVNDVFLKLWEDGDKMEIESSLKSYIYRSIINRSINALKRNRRELNKQVSTDSIQNESYELLQIEENELKVRLYKAIDNLPDQCRKVFEMSRFTNLKQQEIADKLGISIKTVKNHITIALKQLNKAMSNYIVILTLILKNIVSLY